MKRFAEYLRFSTSPQDKLSSPEAHHQANLEYVQRSGGELVQSYKDLISGRVKARQGWAALLADARLGRFDAVVFYDITRAGRKAGVTHAMADELLELGLEVHSTLHGHYHLEDDAGEFKFGVDALFAQADYTRTKRRLYDARVSAALDDSRGLPTGRLPLGLRRAYDPDSGRAYAVYDEEGRALALEIFRAIDAGTGPYTIADRLNARGVPSPMGKLWNSETIYKMIRNPAMLGEWRLEYRRRGQVVTVTKRLPPVIEDRELWQRVQLRVQNPRRGGPKATWAGVFPLTGLMVCAHCGRRLTVAGARNWPNSCKVHCEGKRRGCEWSGYLHYFTLQRVCYEGLQAVLRAGGSVVPHQAQHQPQAQAADAARLEARRRRILDGYEAGLYSLPEARRRLEALAQVPQTAPTAGDPQAQQINLPLEPTWEQIRASNVVWVVSCDRQATVSVSSGLTQ